MTIASQRVRDYFVLYAAKTYYDYSNIDRTWKALRLKRRKAVGVPDREANLLAQERPLEIKALKEIAEIKQAQAEL